MTTAKRMQIVVPMSGFGERFRRVGYQVPKPLIEVDGKPIIAHVIDMFPGETDFLFICNNEHLSNPDYRMQAILQEYCPTGKVVGIAPHKLGPLYAIRQVEHLIDPNRPVVVNYCDFTCYWDWEHFKKFVSVSECLGSIPSYKGFHPNSLGDTMYCYMRETDGWITDIQEKQAYTDNRMQEYASSGTYYFASGAIMSDAMQKAVLQNLNTGGEFFVSLAYQPMLDDNLPITVYPLQHFMQWGTPADLAEYNNWSKAFNQLGEQPQSSQTHTGESENAQGSLVIPMAGLGQRFAVEGYAITKPLIPVSGRPMVLQATHDLPAAKHHAFVLRSDMPGFSAITEQLESEFSGATIVQIPSVTEGQACTALIGLNELQNAIGDVPGPITFGACDNGALYDKNKLQALLDNPEIDVIVWGTRGYAHAVRNPTASGWIDANADGNVNRIAVKTPLSSPATDPAVVGTFTFKRAADFQRVVASLIARNGRINNEFYIDACINDAIEMGLRCVMFEIDSYLCWGTPNDLRTFEYWQSCFHKWPSHSYRLEHDSRIPALEVEGLSKRFSKMVPSIPEPMGELCHE